MQGLINDKKKYWQETAAIRIGNEIGQYEKKSREGVKQVHILSTELFLSYSELIVQSIEYMPDKGQNIKGMLYKRQGAYNKKKRRFTTVCLCY